jgi:hypothetical protein
VTEGVFLSARAMLEAVPPSVSLRSPPPPQAGRGQMARCIGRIFFDALCLRLQPKFGFVGRTRCKWGLELVQILEPPRSATSLQNINSANIPSDEPNHRLGNPLELGVVIIGGGVTPRFVVGDFL